MFENKYGKTIFSIFSLLCFIAIFVCIICDYALNRRLVWSAIPTISILYSWFLLMPAILARKNRIFFLLVGLTYTTVPFLYLLERFTIVKAWFFRLGAPVTIFTIIILWFAYFIIKRAGLHIWHILSLLSLGFGVLYNAGLSYCITAFWGEPFLSLNFMISAFSSLVLAIILAVVGFSVNERKKLSLLDE